MKKMRKTLALVLCLIICFGMLPTWALAEDDTSAEEPAAEMMQEETQEIPEAEQAEESEAPTEEVSAYEEPASEDAAMEEPTPEPAEEAWPEETPDADESAVADEPEVPAAEDNTRDESENAPVNTEATEPATESEEPVEVELTLMPVQAEDGLENTEKATLQKIEETAILMAASGTCGDNLTWTLDDEGVLTISGTGYMTGYNPGSRPWTDNLTDIRTVLINAGVLNIGDGAFSGCSSLETIVLPDTITNIGDYAFRNCTNLKEVSLPTSLEEIGKYAFQSCSSLHSVIVPEGVISIGQAAFAICSSLSSISLPESLTSIGESAFTSCKLRSIVIPKSIKKIPKDAFNYNYELTDVYYGSTKADWDLIIKAGGNDILDRSAIHCTDIVSGKCGTNLTWVLNQDGLLSIYGTGEMKKFSNSAPVVPWTSCKENIKRVALPNGLTNIMDSAFFGCNGLTSITIPESVTTIGNSAFVETGLTNITIPNQVTKIGKETFAGCKNLAEIVIPKDMTSIGDYAFSGCESLSNILVPESVISIGIYAFHSCRALESVKIPEGVKQISACAFMDCSNLTAVIIPKSVKTICERAFDACTKLQKVSIPNGVTDIEKQAFERCLSLTSIQIPESVSSIQFNSFAFTGLKNIGFLGNPPVIDTTAFTDVIATATYLPNNGWQANNMQDYGGTLTWIENGFDDVIDPSAYYYTPVYWATNQGITSGTSATTFSPYNSCTRAQVMSFLYKAQGSPEVSGSNPFTDVKESDYFYKPVLWAVSQGITSGTSATTFSPYNPCTRAQVMSFLYKAMGSPEVSGSNPFTDVKESDYFYKPVLWAVSRGITNGTSATTFGPYNTCTRAQVMTFLYKAMN